MFIILKYINIWVSVIAQLIKHPPAIQETLVQFLGQEDPWRRDRLPTPVFLGFPCGSAGKESACNEGGLGWYPWAGEFPWRRERLLTPVFWPGDFHGLYSPWGGEESDTTEWLSLSCYCCSDPKMCAKHTIEHKRWQ